MTRTTRTILTVTAAVAAALGLAACGDDAGGDRTTGAAPADTTQTSEAATTPDRRDDATESATSAPAETTAATPAGTQQEGATVGSDASIAAADTAEAEVPGSRAFDLEFNDNGTYDIDVTDGTMVQEMVVDMDVVILTETDDLDDDDRAELDAASVTMQEAIATALADTPGTVNDAELDDEDGSVDVRWEIDILPAAGGGEVEIHVDAATGQIVR